VLRRADERPPKQKTRKKPPKNQKKSGQNNFFCECNEKKMADVCADEYQLQTLSAMAAAGITPLVHVSTVLTTRSMQSTERYGLPDHIGTVLNDQCISLEPVFSKGIYRPIPAGARVTEINATAVTLGSSVPFAAGKAVTITPVFRPDPYATAYNNTTDVTISSAAITGGNGAAGTVVVAPVSFSLVQGAPLTAEGVTVVASSETQEYLPRYNAAKAPCYFPVDMYPALWYRSDAGPLPRDLVLQIDISYETPRTMDAFEPAF
jgi:hypothetical protein